LDLELAMKFRPDSAEAHQRMMTFIEEMEGQSDRGVAIVGAAWIEEAMSAAIESFLLHDTKAWQRLFGGNGPLASFSAKIDLSRLLGLISDIIKSDLHIIREVRNEFAHQIAHKTEHTKLGFASPYIKDKCLAIKCVAHEGIADSREAFIRSCAVLYAEFETLWFFGLKVSDGGYISARIERE
jgi:DNA-binding MltR family transcriptional regulator